jgi:hypothetical protein
MANASIIAALRTWMAGAIDRYGVCVITDPVAG